jgi:predicted amidohydrolase/NH3-dependent NAD+ synthetase
MSAQSTDRLVISLAQLNPILGDIAANMAMLRSARAEAAGQGADLLVTPALFASGAPLEDLALRRDFLAAVRGAVETFAPETLSGPAVLLGVPWSQEDGIHDAVLLLDRGEIRTSRFRHEFSHDAPRVFRPGPPPGPIAFRGSRLGVMIGEDMARPEVTETLQESGAQLLLALDAAPYETGILDERLSLAVSRVTESGLALAYVNSVGGQDERVFDGASFVLGADRRLAVQAPEWRETVIPTVWQLGDDDRWHPERGMVAPPESLLPATYRALVLGLGDYVRKNGFSGVVLAPAEGIAAALATAIAVDALGADKVQAVNERSGWAVLSAGAKAEIALGEDRSLADYAVLKDVDAATVQALARWRNGTVSEGASGPVVPERLLAESVDTTRDDILLCLIDRGMTPAETAAKGHDPALVQSIQRQFDRAELARRRAPPGVMLTRRALGRVPRYPITNRFSSESPS